MSIHFFPVLLCLRAYVLLSGVTYSIVAAWLSGSALVSISEVTLCRAQLVLGWIIYMQMGSKRLLIGVACECTETIVVD